MNAEEWKIILAAKEPSSWAGLAAVLSGFGVPVPVPWVHAISLIGCGIASALAIALREKGQATKS